MYFLVHKKAGVYQVKRYWNQIAPLTCVLARAFPWHSWTKEAAQTD